jgi:hypothetical protein
MANAGTPDVLDPPAGHDPYLQTLQTTNPRFADTVANINWSIKMVEIDPLIAFQYHVFTDHSNALCSTLTQGAPTVAELLPVCLPHDLPSPATAVAYHSGGVHIESDSPNMRLLDAKLENEPATQRALARLYFGVSSPLVSVIRFNGRSYLRNGYHRVYGARQAGATHVPCVFGDASDWTLVGAHQGFFPRPLLESANPPTMGHYTQGRAYPVTLRRVRRVIDLAWSELLIPEP